MSVVKVNDRALQEPSYVRPGMLSCGPGDRVQFFLFPTTALRLSGFLEGPEMNDFARKAAIDYFTSGLNDHKPAAIPEVPLEY